MRSASHWVVPPGPVERGLRIGLLGGSFNPAHDGHLYASLVALKKLRLDYVWWLVSPGNPLKNADDMADMLTRLGSAADIARHPRIRVTDIERRLGTRYTVDTITALKLRFPGVGFVWLMGSDNLVQFARWRRWRDIAAQVPIAVVRRPGSVLASLSAAPVRRFGLAPALRAAPAIVMLDGVRNPQSSTALRRMATVLEPRLPPC
jgi:nicotinate-nucleotide adenylyltransferase